MKQVTDGSTNPGAVRNHRNPELHYVKVEKEDVEKYTDLPSFQDPSKDRYDVISRDRKDTGNSKLALLACSKEDYDSAMKEITDFALLNEARPGSKDETITSPRLMA